tara:strand:- start:2724 stop:4544 length:1821 start_codon:yes stop_codon:yes gene_type:complete
MAKQKVKFELTAVNRTTAAFNKVKTNLHAVRNAGAMVAAGMLVVGAAVIGASKAFVSFTKKTYEFIDAIGKTATRTGITTDAIQAFSLAALESGTSIEGGNKALEKFARSVGDAQRGLKTTKDIFKAIGVELQTNEGRYKSTTQLLEETAVGISNLGSQTEKATALANLFGRQGILLTGALEDLAERGMDGFIERAEELGLVLSEKSIRAVEQFNDKMSVIQLQIRNVTAEFLIGLLPALDLFREQIATAIGEARGEFQDFERVGRDSFNTIIDTFVSLAEVMKFFSPIMAFQLNNARALFFGLVGAIQTVEIAFKGFIISNQVLLKEVPLLGAVLKKAGIDVDGFTGALDETVQSLNESVEGAKATQQKLKEVFTFNPLEARGLYDGIITFAEGLKISEEKAKEFSEAMEQAFVDDNLNRLQAINAFKDSLGTVDEALDKVAVSSMKKFEDSIIQGLKNGKLAFKDFATFVVEQLIRVAIQQLIVKNLIDPFRSFLGGTSGGGNNINFAGRAKVASLFGDNEGGGYTGMGARAGGLDGRGGRLTMVHPNETIIDHEKGQSMGATVNFNISTVDAAGFDQLLTSRKGLITSIINNAMNNQGKMGVI